MWPILERRFFLPLSKHSLCPYLQLVCCCMWRLRNTNLILYFLLTIKTAARDVVVKATGNALPWSRSKYYQHLYSPIDCFKDIFVSELVKLNMNAEKAGRLVPSTDYWDNFDVGRVSFSLCCRLFKSNVDGTSLFKD